MILLETRIILVWNGLTNPNSRKGEVERYKGILVAKGFPQHPRIDFGEKFAPIARIDIFRAVLEIASQNKWKVYQMDLKSTFLNDILEE